MEITLRRRGQGLGAFKAPPLPWKAGRELPAAVLGGLGSAGGGRAGTAGQGERLPRGAARDPPLGPGAGVGGGLQGRWVGGQRGPDPAQPPRRLPGRPASAGASPPRGFGARPGKGRWEGRARSWGGARGWGARGWGARRAPPLCVPVGGAVHGSAPSPRVLSPTSEGCCGRRAVVAASYPRAGEGREAGSPGEQSWGAAAESHSPDSGPRTPPEVGTEGSWWQQLAEGTAGAMPRPLQNLVDNAECQHRFGVGWPSLSTSPAPPFAAAFSSPCSHPAPGQTSLRGPTCTEVSQFLSALELFLLPLACPLQLLGARRCPRLCH